MHLFPKPAPKPSPSVVYRLRSWPELNGDFRTAAIYQTLTRMTLGPVTEEWFAAHSGLKEQQASALLVRLVDDGSAERIDVSRFSS